MCELVASKEEHMNQDDIIRMAREAWRLEFIPESDTPKLERFFQAAYAAGAAAEREACAKVCEALRPFGPELALQKATAEDCATAIRARGQK